MGCLLGLLWLLEQKQQRAALSEVDDCLLRNTLFLRADTLFALQDFSKAEDAYALAASRYSDSPEALEAYLRIASCQRQLRDNEAAQQTLLDAQALLRAMPEASDFAATTRYTKQQWLTVLDWMISL